jgi:thiol-activated cytolysin
VALELGFSAKWASGSAAAQLNASTSAERSVVLACFKQVFYSVTLDGPPHPAAVFADGVTVGDVEQACDARHPPAYVRNVDYGRLLLVKMETSAVDTRLKLTGAMQQVTSGGVEAGGSIDAAYTDIVRNATFTVVALGGGHRRPWRTSAAPRTA